MSFCLYSPEHLAATSMRVLKIHLCAAQLFKRHLSCQAGREPDPEHCAAHGTGTRLKAMHPPASAQSPTTLSSKVRGKRRLSVCMCRCVYMYIIYKIQNKSNIHIYRSFCSLRVPFSGLFPTNIYEREELGYPHTPTAGCACRCSLLGLNTL